MTVDRQRHAKPKSGYLLALSGAWVGGFVGLFLVARMISTADLSSGPELIGAVVYGQMAAIPIGTVIGIAVALALFKRAAPVLTAVLSIPVTLVVWAAWYGVWVMTSELSRFIDSMGYAGFLFIPPLTVPLISRWIALSFHRKRSARHDPVAAAANEREPDDRA